MSKNNSISRQLILTLGKASLVTALFSFLTGYFIYTLAVDFHLITEQELMSSEMTLNIVDFIWIGLVTTTGFFISIILGIKLSHRFILPIQSLAESAKQISQGKLGVRAQNGGSSSPAELSRLIDDFNSMASQLETSVKNTTMWNAAIAHELRTPVTVLQGRLHGIIDGVFEPNESLFKDLLGQVEQLSLLIEDLRTLSLAENHQLRMQFAHHPIHHMIIQSIEHYQDRFDQAQLRIQANLTEESCYCDELRIKQILIAIYENAIRYANPGIFKISSKKTADAWILQFEDEGPGIAEQHITQLFEPFYRLEPSRAKDQGGTGLGLSVVQAIVTAHHGQISYEPSSSLGGSCFKISLPLAAEHR